MAFKRGENPNHPKKGSSIKVDPIRDLAIIQRIKRNLMDADKPRDLALFTLGVNTAWRANELLSIRVGQVRGLGEGGVLELKQSKTNAYRITPLNRTVIRALSFWLAVYDTADDDAPLFPSRYGDPLGVPALCDMVKTWSARAGAFGHFGSHSLRKSWGYHQRVTFLSPLMLITRAFGHATERQTLDYLGIQPREIGDLFKNEV